MDAWVIFRRARVILLSFLVLICLTLATLFAIFLFHEWTLFSKFQKVIAVSSLSLYGFSAILLYLMVVIHFHLWWDVARLFALLVVHAGSSVLFTIYRPSFPCRGFGTETACRKFVFTIFIASWVLSGIILCFVICLGIMALIPRPVESSQEAEEVDVPSTPASFIAGSLSPMDERRMSAFYSVDSRTGFVSYGNGGKSSDYIPSPVNGAHGETITMGPPRLWHGFESPNLRHNNNAHGGTMSMRNAPTEHTSVISRPRRVDPFHHNPLGNPSPPPTSIYSRARPGVGGKNSSIAENRLNQSSAFPGLKRDALSPHTLHDLHGPPPPVSTSRGLATEDTPSLYYLSHDSAPPSPGDHSQREQTHPDRARRVASSVYSFQSSAASVHPMWVEPTPQMPPLPALTPDTARLRGTSPFFSSGNNGPFATSRSRSNTPLTPELSKPHGTMQYYGARRVNQSQHHPPVEESSSSRRGSEVLDPTGWRQLVLNAAAKP